MDAATRKMGEPEDAAHTIMELAMNEDDLSMIEARKFLWDAAVALYLEDGCTVAKAEQKARTLLEAACVFPLPNFDDLA